MNKAVPVLALSLILFTALGSADSFILDSENDWNTGSGVNTTVNGSLLEMNSFNNPYEDYTLNTGEGLSYSGNSLDVSGQSGDPAGFAWTGSGDGFIIVQPQTATHANMYEYDCSTPYDVTSCSYTGASLDMSSENFVHNGVDWSGAGDKFITVSSGADQVFQYSCTTNYDLSTCSYSSNSLDVLSEDDGAEGVVWSGSGDKLFVGGRDSDAVLEYDCSTPYDVTSCSYSGSSLDISSESDFPNNLVWSGSGDRLFVSDNNADNVFEYDCSTSYDVSSCSYSSSLDVSGNSPVNHGLDWSGSGDRLFIASDDDVEVNEYVGEDKIGVDSPASFTSDVFDVGERGRWLSLSADATLNGGSGKVVLDLDNDRAMRSVDRRKTVQLEDGENSVRFNLEGFRYARYKVSMSDSAGSPPGVDLDSVSAGFERIDDGDAGSSGPVFGGGGGGDAGGFAQSIVDFFSGIGQTLLGFFS